MVEVLKFGSETALFNSLVKNFLDTAKEAISKCGLCNVAVSGGATPLPFFNRLSKVNHDFNEWHLVNFFWVDERFVPAEDKENNFTNAWQAGLENLPARFFPMYTSFTSTQQACVNYQEKLQQVFKGFPSFDWLLLGAGADGHTGSIFYYDGASLAEPWVVETVHPLSRQLRMSLSLPVITNAKKILLVLRGMGEKRFAEGTDQNKGQVTCLTDLLRARKRTRL